MQMRRPTQTAQQTTAGQQEAETAQNLWREIHMAAQQASTKEEKNKVLQASSALHKVLPIVVGLPGERMQSANELTTTDVFAGRHFDITGALGTMAQTLGQHDLMVTTIKAYTQGGKPVGASEGASTKQLKYDIKNAEVLLKQVVQVFGPGKAKTARNTSTFHQLRAAASTSLQRVGDLETALTAINDCIAECEEKIYDKPARIIDFSRGE